MLSILMIIGTYTIKVKKSDNSLVTSGYTINEAIGDWYLFQERVFSKRPTPMILGVGSTDHFFLPS